MKEIKVSVELDDRLSIRLQDTGSGEEASLVAGSPSNEDTQVEDFSLNETCRAELIYQASVQPCLVLGLALPSMTDVTITSTSSKVFRLVVALAGEAGYSEPVVDTMVESIDCHIEKFSVGQQ